MQNTILQPVVQVIYNKKDITENISKYIESLTYTDYEKDQSDELSIVLNDYDKLFQNNWYPEKGDKISAKIGYKGQPLLDCGVFTIDEPDIELSVDGDKFTINALAASINEKIRQKNSKSYVNKTLIDIAREIAKKHGYTVAGNGSAAIDQNSKNSTNIGAEGEKAGFIKIPYEIQYKESDIAFLARIAQNYGYIFKLTDNVISFVPAENLETSKSLSVITRKDIKSAHFRDCGTKKYTACSARYLNPKTGKYVSYTARAETNTENNETFKLDTKYSTKEAAIRAANAGLKNGSKEVEGEIEFVLGHTKAIAGVNFDINFNIVHDGKFHITQSTHTVTRENYETSISIRKAA